MGRAGRTIKAWHKKTQKLAESWSFVAEDGGVYKIPLKNTDDNQDVESYLDSSLFSGTYNYLFVLRRFCEKSGDAYVLFR